MTLPGLMAAASAAERAADWERAFTGYERLFQAATHEGAVETVADALRGMSRACQHRRRLEEAEELAQLSFEIAERSGSLRAAARAVNTLGVIRFLRHDAPAAGSLYRDALERAANCGDDPLVGWSCQNLGILANLAGDLREARALYLESVASSIRSGDDTTAVSAYNSLGMISSDLEEWTESLLYYDRGLEVAEELGDLSVQATLLANRAIPLIAMGETERAISSLDEAEAVAQRISSDRTLSEIYRFRGRIARLQGRDEESEAHLERALRAAEAGELELEKAEATEELARLRWQQQRRGAARVLAREALRSYWTLAAAQRADTLQRLLAEWDAGTAAEPVILP